MTPFFALLSDRESHGNCGLQAAQMLTFFLRTHSEPLEDFYGGAKSEDSAYGS